MIEKFKILSSKLAYHGAVLDFYSKKMKIPNGNIATWDVLEHRGAAAIIPVTDEGKIIMVRQYRGGNDSIMLEIPAGGRDSLEEDMKVCAMRELEEETGHYAKPEDVHHLIDFYSAPAYTSEKIGIFYSEKLFPSKQHLDENEFVELEEYTLEELISMIEQGELTDGKSIAAILAYQNLKNKEI